MAPRSSAGGPAIALIISGVLGLLYALLYFMWTLVPLAWGMFGSFAIITDSKSNAGDAVGATLMFLTFPALQCAVYAVCVITGLITLVGGVRFNQFRSRGLVWLAVLSSTATPVLGLFATSASALNCGSAGVGLFGCLFGNVGTIPILVVGLVATVWGIVAMSSDEIAARFDATA